MVDAERLGRFRMTEMFHEGNRQLQDRFDSRRLADRLAERSRERSLQITDDDRAFIEARDMFFLATADAAGRPNCSYKGGDPGFVRVVDEHTVAFPSYDGNGMFISTGNTLVNPHVGLLFVDFEGQRRLRLNGVASIDPDDRLLLEFPGAQFVVRVEAREIFANCPRYVHRYQLAERSSYVPRAESEPPIPEWKRSEWAHDLLPANDPARRPSDASAPE
jgi:predicted pyridoxine 5'-phosphate oxidase superfamily flavin-nucleotide-binding protein